MNICKTEKEYIEQIALPVQKCCKKYGYLPSVLIAQSCLENGYGIPSYWDNPQISALMKYNNMVGIKTELLNKSWSDIGLSVWPGKSLKKQTPEEYNGQIVTINDSFRKYDNVEQSFADYLCFMTWASNYGPGGDPKYGKKVLTIKDPETLIKKVSSLGYATGSTYPTSVMRILKKHDLTKYDDLSNVKATKYYPKEEVTLTIRTALAKLGVTLIDRIAANKSQVPAHNANSHQYFAVHYLGVNGENPDLYGGGYGGHFYVSKNGKCYQAAEVTDKVWHVGASSGFSYIHPYARNANTVGVECATYTASGKNNDSETWYFTEATQITAAKLAAAFMVVYGLDMDHLLRHGDITTKNCPSPYKRDEGKGSNWTWAQFKKKVAEYINILNRSDVIVQDDTTINGTYVLKSGDSGDKVKQLQEQLLLTGFADCAFYLNEAQFVTGKYDSNTVAYVKLMQQAAGIDVDGIYGPQSQKALAKYIKAATGTKIDFTVNEFLSTAKSIAAQNKKNGFSYGNAKCLPSVNSADKLTSCDRFVDQVLFACGLKDIGNRSITDICKFLESKGAKKITDVSTVKAGDIMVTNVDGLHTFILGNKVSNDIWERYDSGSDNRIHLDGEYESYKSQPFKEKIVAFCYAYRMPFKVEQVTPTPEKPATKKSYIYRVQVGAYSVKANADKMLARARQAGFNAFINDYGAKVKDRYRVQIGAYSVKANATKQRAAAIEKGFSCIVRKEELA